MLINYKDYKMDNIDEQYAQIIREAFKDDKVYEKLKNDIDAETIALRFTDLSKQKEYLNAVTSNPAMNGGLMLLRQGDVAFLAGHGSPQGHIAHYNIPYQKNSIVQRLEDAGFIPEDIKKIYTISCYGGVQTDFVTNRGIPITSIHTSKNPLLSISNKESGVTFKTNTDGNFNEPKSIKDSFVAKQYKQFIIERFKHDPETTFNVELIASREQINDVLRPIDERARQYYFENIDSNPDFFEKVVDIDAALDQNISSPSDIEKPPVPKSGHYYSEAEAIEHYKNKIVDDIPPIEYYLDQGYTRNEAYQAQENIRKQKHSLYSVDVNKTEPNKIESVKPKIINEAQQVSTDPINKESINKEKIVNNIKKEDFKLTNKQIGIVAGASIAALSTIGLVAIHNKKQKEENKLKKEQYKNRQYNYEPQEFDTNYSKEVAKTISSFNNRRHL